MLLTAKWVLPISKPPIEGGAILVKEGNIVEVGPLAELAAKNQHQEVKDLGLSVLMPGFIDAHSHLEYSVFRGSCDDLAFSDWKLQLSQKSSMLSGDDWLISARLGALEAIASGITSIADTTNTGASFLAAKEAGLSGIIFCEVMGMDSSKVDEIIEAAKERVKIWQAEANGTALSIGVSPYSVYAVSPQLFKAVSLWAKEEGLTVSFHLAGSPDEVEFVKYGASPLATKYLKQMGWNDLLWQPMGVSPVKYVEQWGALESGKVIAVHCVQVDDNDIDILKKYGVSVAHCPKCSAKLGMGIAPLGKFISRGIKVGIGMDSPASNNTLDMFDEMRVGLLLQRGKDAKADPFTAEIFVRMATLGGAEALGLAGAIGSLEKGKMANVIAVDISNTHSNLTCNPYSSLVYGANQEDVIFTMIGGRAVYEGGEHLTLDKSMIKAAAEPVIAKLKG